MINILRSLQTPFTILLLLLLMMTMTTMMMMMTMMMIKNVVMLNVRGGVTSDDKTAISG